MSPTRPHQDLNQIGTRGLVIFDGSGFFYVDEPAWRAAGPLNPVPEQFPLSNLESLGVVFAELNNLKSVYVDLDKLPMVETDDRGQAGLENKPTSQGTSLARDTDWSIMLHEKDKNREDKLYQVPKKMWKPLAEGFEGDAGVLVNRGTLVAAIPKSDLSIGTFCVLINLERVLDPAAR